jgi:signal transduction histidine kinase
MEWTDLFWLYGVPLFTACMFFVYGLIVWTSEFGGVAARSVLLFCLGVVVSLLLLFDATSTYRFHRLHLAAVSLLPAATVYMGLHFPSQRRLVERFPAVQGHAFIFTLFIGVLLQVFFYRIRGIWVFVDQLNRGLIIVALGVFVLTSAIAYRESYILMERLRARVVLMAAVLIVSVPVLLAAYCRLLQIPIPPNLFLLPLALFPGSIAYAISRHDLFQVSPFVKKGVSAALWSYCLSALHTALIVFGARALGVGGAFIQSPYAPPLVFVGLLTFTTIFYDVLKAFLTRPLVEREQRYRETVAGVGESLVQVFDAGHVARRLEKGIRKAMGVERIAFFQWNEKSKSYLLWPGKWRDPELVREILSDHPLVQVLSEKKTWVMAFEVERDPRYPEVRGGVLKGLTRLEVEVVVPVSYGKPSQLIGFILLGRKGNNELYGMEDMELLQMLSRNVAVALVNARSVERIEEQTEAMSQMERLSELGTISAGVNHEVKNLVGAVMMSIRLYTQAIEQLRGRASVVQDPEALKELEEMERNMGEDREVLDRAVEVADMVKEFAHPSLGEELEGVDLRRCLQVTTRLMSPELNESKVQVEIRGGDVPKVWGKSGQVHQMLMNFIKNSRDAIVDRRRGESGWVGRIGVELQRNGEWVELKICDNGCGITPEGLGNLFKRFQTTKGVGRGTGLGLALSKEVMDKWGGRIGVESQVEVGTTFTLQFVIVKG